MSTIDEISGISHRKKVQRASLFAFAVILAFAQHQLLQSCLTPIYDTMVEAMSGIATGHPHWRVYQSRIAGPWLFTQLSRMGLEAREAYSQSALLLLLVFYGTIAACLQDLLADWKRVALGLLTCFAAIAILIVQTSWFYLWDLIDLSIFSVFTWELMKRARPWVLLSVTALEFFNREVALVMALFLTLEGLILFGFRRQRENLIQAILGACLLVAGFCFIQWLRNTFFIAATMPSMTGKSEGENFMFQFISNGGILLRHLGFAGYIKNLPQLAVLLACLAATFVNLLSRPRIAVFHALLGISILAFGVVIEWRVWLALVPMVAMTVALFPEWETTDNGNDQNPFQALRRTLQEITGKPPLA